MIWCLGDAVQGHDLEHLYKMSDLQEKVFAELDKPLCYTTGNHDFDFQKLKGANNPLIIPFYEAVRDHPGWYTTKKCSDPYFEIQLGDFTVYFFSDHVAQNKEWFSSHGRIHGDESKYPHFKLYDDLRQKIKDENRPVITASHYAYVGGNRHSDLLSRLLPLPNNVKIHFYGHAHIGDFMWALEHAYRRICWVDWHDIPQVNVSSFENIRGIHCRSVFLHIYEDNSMGIFFRNHDDHVFSECYFPAKVNHPSKHDQEQD